jgi:hypothetical protein
MPAKRTVDCKGATNVVIKNTGNDKAHFTVVLLCCGGEEGSKGKGEGGEEGSKHKGEGGHEDWDFEINHLLSVG